MTWLSLWAQLTPAPAVVSSWFPIVAWAFAALITGAGAMYGWGKWIQTLNGFRETTTREIDGFGERVGVNENRLAWLDGQHQTMQKNIATVLNQHGTLLERLGEAKRSAEKCGEDIDIATNRIEVKIDALSKDVSKIDKELSQKVAALEATGTRLRHNT